jgi:hypothetical protein
MARLQALRVGHALDLGAARSGIVHSVHVHAVNLEMAQQLWTLTGSDGPDLPLGIRVAAAGFGALRLRRGDRVALRAGVLGVAGRTAVVVDCRAARRWLPVRPGSPAPGLAQRLHVVAAVVCERAWAHAPGIARSVCAALTDPAALAVACRFAVGRGPGATPSGDDVLAGIFAVLCAWPAASSAAVRARWLAGAVEPRLAATTDLGAHLLRQAAAGRFARPVHELVAALVGDGVGADLDRALREVVAMGSTSGADLCAGVLAAAPSMLACGDERLAA